MKLQIDTKDKTIKIQEGVNLKELLDFIEKQFPHTWNKFTLETETFTSEGPWIVPTWPYWQNPWWINDPVIVKYDGTGTSNNLAEDEYMLTDGIYNVSIS